MRVQKICQKNKHHEKQFSLPQIDAKENLKLMNTKEDKYFSLTLVISQNAEFESRDERI